MFGLGIWEIIGIVAIVLLLFGATKLPKLLRGMGQGVREFKEAIREPDEKEPEDAGTPSELPPSDEAD